MIRSTLERLKCSLDWSLEKVCALQLLIARGNRFSRKSNFSRRHLDGLLDPTFGFFGARSTNGGSDRPGGHNVPRKPLERERFGPLKGFTANRLPRRSHTRESPPLIDRDPPSRTFARSVTYNGDIDTGPHRMSPSNELPQTLSCRERRS